VELEPEAEWVQQAIIRLTGLVFPESRRKVLADGLERATRRAGAPGIAAYLARLEADPDSELLDDLVADITVGETYFFRDLKQFGVIRDRILPSLVEHKADRPLRLWSAGCASGEEPYTLAILLSEAGLCTPGQILGTDLSRAALARARRGRYGRWSLRGVPDDVVSTHFEPLSGEYSLRPGVRRLVEFRYLNLVADTYPSLATGVCGLDLILCRNVFIYFDEESTRRVASRLLDSLAPGGWLLMGASDPPLSGLVSCDVVVTPAGLAYRRPGGPRASVTGMAPRREAASAPPIPSVPSPTAPSVGTTAPASHVPSPASTPSPKRPSPPTGGRPPAEGGGERPERPAPATRRGPTETARAYTQRDYGAAVEMATRLIRQGAHGIEPWVILVRSHANVGDLDAAGRACAAGMDRHRTSAELAYLHGVLLAEAGRAEESAVALRAALYLDRSLVIAHLALSDVLKRLGDASAARRSLRNAERLLGGLAPDEIVPASDGERAGRLAAITRAQLAVLDPEAA
jgi:chemotaxis protein methyltransferase CheR